MIQFTEDKLREATREISTNTKIENGVNHHSSDDNQSDSSENHKSPNLAGYQKTQTMREMLAGIPGISMKVSLKPSNVTIPTFWNILVSWCFLLTLCTGILKFSLIFFVYVFPLICFPFQDLCQLFNFHKYNVILF